MLCPVMYLPKMGFAFERGLYPVYAVNVFDRWFEQSTSTYFSSVLPLRFVNNLKVV